MSAERQIIDLHSHWFSKQVLELLSARSVPPRIVTQPGGLAMQLSGHDAPARQMQLSDQWFDIQARLDHLDEHGIVHQLISWPTTLGVDVALGPDETLPLWSLYNDDLGGLVNQYPDRFSGVAALSTVDIEWSVRELRRAHEELGLIGGVLPVGSVASVEAAQRFVPVFEVAQELGSHLYLHTGYANAAVPGQPLQREHGDNAPIRSFVETSAHFAHAVVTLAYSDLFDVYPDITFQIAMLGGSGLIALIAEQVLLAPERLGEFDMAKRFGRIYLDTGAAGRGSEAIGLATRVFGASQIVFGTDLGPFASVEGVIANVESAPITEADRQLIYFDTAERLLDRPGGRPIAAAVTQRQG
jgi:predicted TIM-barrel fold metal-dependent hydrolase